MATTIHAKKSHTPAIEFTLWALWGALRGPAIVGRAVLAAALSALGRPFRRARHALARRRARRPRRPATVAGSYGFLGRPQPAIAPLVVAALMVANLMLLWVVYR